MNRLINMVLIVMVLAICAGNAHAGKAKAKGQSSDAAESDLVTGVMSIDAAITAVRPARTVENAQPVIKVQWSPAITLKKNTPPDQQLAIAQKVAAFVVDFQGGVATHEVMGGILVFIEGESGWTPTYGQVAYKIENGRVTVWADKYIIDGTNISCCDEGPMIGTITGNKMTVAR